MFFFFLYALHFYEANKSEKIHLIEV